jgi:hypothetical protein
MSCDKAIQTECEDDVYEMELESTSSDTESSDSKPPFYETLPESEQEELVESIYDFIREYMEGDNILKMAKPDFHREMVDDITHILFQHLQDANICDDNDFDSMHEFVSHYIDLWYQTKEDINYPMRSIPHYIENFHAVEYGLDDAFVKEYIDAKLEIIQKKDAEGPKQRTVEWYQRRYNMLTASNLWQVFASEAQQNRIIYEKCKPLELGIVESKWMSTEGSLHWGVKYEPLTVMVYEKLTGAKVQLFGCIQHTEYSILGASPDGIVVNSDSPLYGRLVEIKNIYNREMDGTPSEAYWIQQQIQLECCNMDVCDFVETRFKEYESEQEFLSADDATRGIILHFVPRDGKSNLPLYKYMPLDILIEERETWIENIKQEVAEQYVLFTTIYWCLDDIQMSMVIRNTEWFKAALPRIQQLWTTIETERITGYQHRAAKKRATTDVIVIDNGTETRVIQNNSGGICLIKLSEEDRYES